MPDLEVLENPKTKLASEIISSDNKGLVVQPEGCEMSILIKKSQIAVNASDARPSRFVGGERIDSAIAELNLRKKKSISKY